MTFYARVESVLQPHQADETWALLGIVDHPPVVHLHLSQMAQPVKAECPSFKMFHGAAADADALRKLKLQQGDIYALVHPKDFDLLPPVAYAMMGAQTVSPAVDWVVQETAKYVMSPQG